MGSQLRGFVPEGVESTKLDEHTREDKDTDSDTATAGGDVAGVQDLLRQPFRRRRRGKHLAEGGASQPGKN